MKYCVVTQGDMQHLYGLKLKEVVERPPTDESR
jgi:hypothetical protein